MGHRECCGCTGILQEAAVDNTAREEASSDAGSASQLSASTPATTPPQQHSPLHRQDLPAPTISSGSTTTSFGFPPVQVIDTDFGQKLIALARPSGQNEAPRVYGDVLEQMKVGNFAHPEGLAVLIGAFGRLVTWNVLKSFTPWHSMSCTLWLVTPLGSPKAWFSIEDSMIQALSHAGRPEAATTHRHRIIAAEAHLLRLRMPLSLLLFVTQPTTPPLLKSSLTNRSASVFGPLLTCSTLLSPSYPAHARLIEPCNFSTK